MTRPPVTGAAILPGWAAVTLVVMGGGCAATQAAINGELGQRLGSPLGAAAVSNTLGGLLFVAALATLPRVRAGVRKLWNHRLPLWMYCGGVFGGVFVFAGSFAVPLIGVGLFTVAQVCGNTMGALGSDAAGLGPSGRLRVTGYRLTGAGVAVVAIVVAQAGRDLATAMWWLVPFIAVVGVGLALQGALNGRVNEVTTNALSTGLVNFVAGTTVLYLAVAAVAVLSGGFPITNMPGQWWLYLGGPIGSLLVVFSMLAIKTIGVLRMALGILAGQLTGALVIDVMVADTLSLWTVAGVVLTAAAVAIAGMGKSTTVTGVAADLQY